MEYIIFYSLFGGVIIMNLLHLVGWVLRQAEKEQYERKNKKVHKRRTVYK